MVSHGDFTMNPNGKNSFFELKQKGSNNKGGYE